MTIPRDEIILILSLNSKLKLNEYCYEINITVNEIKKTFSLNEVCFIKLHRQEILIPNI